MSSRFERLRHEALSELSPDSWRRALFEAVPADKFILPSADLEHGAWIQRPRVNEAVDRAFHRHAVVCMSGSPGSGKSVAAAQFIDVQGSRGLWYRVGREDLAPHVVLGSLLHLLERALPHYRCEPAQALLETADDPDPQGLIGAVNQMLNAAAPLLEEPLFLALDDLHCLNPASDGGRLLLHALATLPPGLKCLAVARHPMAALRAQLRPERYTEIGGTPLALTPEETQELCRMSLHSSLPASVCQAVHERTLGWARGAVAFARALEHQLLDEGQGPSVDLLSGPPSAELLALDGYFEYHVIRSLEPALRTRLCELCWLDELSPELVGDALGIDDVPGLLSRLFSLGLLRRPPGQPSGNTLQLHPLLADFLRRRARRSLPADRPANIRIRAAEHLQARGEHERAIDYLLDAEAYPRAAALLQSKGLALLAQGRFEAVLLRIERLPIDRLADSCWLLLVHGIALLEVNPTQALPPLQQALSGFEAENDAAGKAICLAQQVTYHAGIDGDYFRIPALLESLERLIDNCGAQLAEFSQVLANLAIAAGKVLTGRPGNVDVWLHEALAHAQARKVPNLEVRVRIIRCYRQLHRGELRAAAAELERLSAFVERSDVGNMAKALIHAQQCRYLAMTDARESFSRHRHRFLRASLGSVRQQALTSPLLCRWACEVALGAGHTDEAWVEVENGLSLGYAAANPNLRSQFLLFRALLLAMQNQHERARSALSEADCFFERFGTGPFEAQRALLTGAVRLICGELDNAGQWLSTAAQAAEESGTKQVRAGTHAFACRLALELGDEAAARTEAEAFLRLMREQRYDTYFLCEPVTLGRVLGCAAERGIERETVDRLARRLLNRAPGPDGEQVPLLRLELLGRIRMAVAGQEISGDQLPRRERTYVATLGGADDQRIDRERLFDAIWPGGEHNSANIYVVRNRLKNSLRQAAPGVEPENYFRMTASVVRLDNAWVDAAAYRRLVETGLNHWVRGEHWQAECRFQEADALWGGGFAPMTEENDLIREYRLRLQRLTEQRTLAWAALLEQRGALAEAESVLERYLELDPISEEVVQRLYTLRRHRNAIAAAERVLSDYRRRLEAEQFDTADIERTLESIRGSR